MAVLLSFSIRRTSGNDGRSAIRAMSSASSYHLRPHCTRRAASAITCSRAPSAASAAGAALKLPTGLAGADLAAGGAAGLAGGKAALGGGEAGLGGGALFAGAVSLAGCLG